MSDENLHEEPEKVEEEKKDEDISQVSYGQCYICKINVQYNSFQVFSCRHIICYTCISRLLLIDELSCLENKSNVTIPCTCNKGNIVYSYKELMDILTILILPIHEHGIFLQLLVSSLISFTSVL